MYIHTVHVCMLRKAFGLMPIKFGFFTNFSKLGEIPCAIIVQNCTNVLGQILIFSTFTIFSDTYSVHVH